MDTNEPIRTEEYPGQKPATLPNGRLWAGLLIIVIGAALLAYQLEMVFLPSWIFTWPMILIVIGFFSGLKHSFRNPGWVVPVLIGTIFLVRELEPAFYLVAKPYFWPVLLIVGGLWVIFKPRHYSNSCKTQWAQRNSASGLVGTDQPMGPVSKEDFINGTAVFGGIKKTIITKEFKGGQITTVFGGAEYNLTHADLQGEVVIDLTMMFGGTSLIIPADWKVRSEVAAVFGGIDEKRAVVQAALQTDKVLVLKGTLVFGGIDIKSY